MSIKNIHALGVLVLWISSAQELVPAHVATAKPAQQWTGSCFANMQVESRMTAPDVLAVTITGSNPTAALCGDLYILSTRFHEEWVYLEDLSPNTTVFFTNVTGPVAQDIANDGVSVLVAPCGLVGTIESLVKTATLFFGEGNAIFKANMDFMEEKGLLPRNNPAYNTTQAVDASLIQSGDYFAVLRLDGLDPMIAFGTGGVTGHSTVAVWRGSGAERQLYVVESTDVTPFGPAYWPPPYGIIVTPYEQWITQAEAAHYHVNLLPISRSLTFDEDAFWTWFATVKGEEYGYSRMLLSFLDTSGPQRSLPAPIDDAVEKWLVQTLDLVLPYNASDPGAKVTTYRMLLAAANQRLGTKCFTVECIQRVLVGQNRSITAVLSEPELDSYKYNNSDEMVCSEFAARAWIAGFGTQLPAFQGSEQTPKDNYQFNIYEKNFFDASNCPAGLHTMPDGSNYCQLMGEFQLPLNLFNQIPLYPGINNHCGSQWPDYERCVGGGIDCQC